jgi:hypothetical protein
MLVNGLFCLLNLCQFSHDSFVFPFQGRPLSGNLPEVLRVPVHFQSYWPTDFVMEVVLGVVIRAKVVILLDMFVEVVAGSASVE